MTMCAIQRAACSRSAPPSERLLTAMCIMSMTITKSPLKPGLSIAPSVQHAAIGQPLQLVEGPWNDEQFPAMSTP